MNTSELLPLPVRSYWVVPGRLMAGEYPGSRNDSETRQKLSWLLRQPTQVFIDLTEENEPGLTPYVQLLHEQAALLSRRVVHIRLPRRDFSTPTQDQVVEVLDTLDLALSLGRNMYLHCYGGNGRTGTVVGCYLVRHGLAGNDPLAMIQELRRGMPGPGETSPELEGQKRMVLEWKKGQ